MQTNCSYYQSRKEFRMFVTQTFPDLVELKRAGDQAAFNALVLKIMPEIRSYINGRLNTAIKKGHFSKGKYKADDFIGQLFVAIYDNLEEVSEDNQFYLWLFKKTNELLEDTIVEEEFDDFFFKNIDTYSKPEWDAMEERYSTDGGGDLLMIGELDDRSYNHHDYVLNPIFIEDTEKDLVEKIDSDLSAEDLSRHIQMVLHNLPLPMRNVYELYADQQMALEDIADIRNSTLDEVEVLLNKAKRALQVSLFNRYPVP